MECEDITKDTAEVPGLFRWQGRVFALLPAPRTSDHFPGVVVVQWTWTRRGGIKAAPEWGEGLAGKVFQAVKLSLWSETAEVSG